MRQPQTRRMGEASAVGVVDEVEFQGAVTVVQLVEQRRMAVVEALPALGAKFLISVITGAGVRMW